MATMLAYKHQNAPTPVVIMAVSVPDRVAVGLDYSFDFTWLP